MIRLGGPGQFFCQIRKFLARVLALAGKQKRGALLSSGQRRTHKNLKEKCTSPTPPPLAKIGHQPSHGGDSTSSDAISTKKYSHQRITYPLSSTLMGAIFDWRCPPFAVASSSQKNSQKGMTMMTIDKYCPNASLTRTLICHHGLGMCIALPRPFAMAGGEAATTSSAAAALAEKVANMFATCCRDSQMSAHFTQMPLS